MSGRYKRLAVLVAITPLAPATAQVARPPIPLENPASWIKADDYPPDALRTGQSGVVRASVGIDAIGRAVDCTIKQSSGSSSLDAKTCQLAIQRGRFDPAIDGAGRKIAGTYAFPVKWVIPHDTLTVDLTHGPHEVTSGFEITVGPDGTVLGCKDLVPPQTSPIDVCARMPIGSPTHDRFVRDGKPVGAIIRQHFTYSATATPMP